MTSCASRISTSAPDAAALTGSARTPVALERRTPPQAGPAFFAPAYRRVSFLITRSALPRGAGFYNARIGIFSTRGDHEDDDSISRPGLCAGRHLHHGAGGRRDGQDHRRFPAARCSRGGPVGALARRRRHPSRHAVRARRRRHRNRFSRGRGREERELHPAGRHQSGRSHLPGRGLRSAELVGRIHLERNPARLAAHRLSVQHDGAGGVPANPVHRRIAEPGIAPDLQRRQFRAGVRFPAPTCSSTRAWTA